MDYTRTKDYVQAKDLREGFFPSRKSSREVEEQADRNSDGFCGSKPQRRPGEGTVTREGGSV